MVALESSQEIPATTMGSGEVEKEGVHNAVPVEEPVVSAYQYAPKLNYKVAPITAVDVNKPIELGLLYNVKMGRPALNTNVGSFVRPPISQMEGVKKYQFPTFVDHTSVSKPEIQPLPVFVQPKEQAPLRPLTELTKITNVVFENRVPTLGSTFVAREMAPISVEFPQPTVQVQEVEAPMEAPAPVEGEHAAEEPMAEEPTPIVERVLDEDPDSPAKVVAKSGKPAEKTETVVEAEEPVDAAAEAEAEPVPVVEETVEAL